MSLEDLEIEGWRENRKLVMSELVRVTRAIEGLDSKVGGELTSMKVEIATLKTKVAVYAAMAAVATSLVITAALNYILHR